jgi:hypothetical protein
MLTRAIRFGRLDATTDQAIYRVDPPDLRYDGWVRVSRARHAGERVIPNCRAGGRGRVRSATAA